MELSAIVQVPNGYEIDKEKSTFEKIVFKKLDERPKDWVEIDGVGGYFITEGSSAKKLLKSWPYSCNKNVFATKEQAEASLALAQLSQLLPYYRDGWEPDWNDDLSAKWCVLLRQNVFIVDYAYAINTFLSFPTEKLAKDFLDNFRDLIEQAKPLM